MVLLSIRWLFGRSFESQTMRSREDVTKSDLFKCALALFVLGVGGGRGLCQAFTNLDFEAANVSEYPVNTMNVPISAALPGWSVFSINPAGGTNAGNQMWYDVLSTGGAGISINDKNTGFGFLPIQGNYSAILFGGGGYSTGIDQTGLVPVGSESLQMEITTLGGPLTPFVVTLGGQMINMVPLGSFPEYTLYGGDVSAQAGGVEILSIIEPPPAGTPPSVLVLDNIFFSTSPVPEPGTLALVATGAVLLGLRRGRKGLR
jgi:hypothetical protein